MLKQISVITALLCTVFIFEYCSKKNTDAIASQSYPAITAAFGNNIDPNNFANYAAQPKPNYIVKDNTGANPITNGKATIGRVLFYDKSLSIDNTIACASCHKQTFAFGDTAIQSKGVSGGLTGRHSMRLVNARFANEAKFFWNERAATLEVQTTQPIQDHAEMGFSGQTGRQNLNDLLNKLKGIGYYQELFTAVYGDVNVTEARLQECLSQFIRSIQSFDAKYDAGRALVNNDNQNFPNFSASENAGKNLFNTPPTFDATGNRIAGGLGCGGCHAAPEFDIDPNTRNNGIIGIINATGIDINNTRSPSLRDLLRNGVPNTPMMHTGVFTTVQQVIGHYGNITIAPGNTNLDPRLRPNGVGQKLNVTATEVNNVIAFMNTLSGNNVYTDVKWGNPFK
ncbi:cytochrome-c peroxidase [Ferruginibacter yonginensis]|uniref:Cytochrome-c peroxidase n=1 Tax=Ferruginibacter yonginensis TaxID=1310416 RepID=A0ABV8QRT2_9BACT